MANMTVSNFGSLLKQTSHPDKIAPSVYDDNPLLGLIQKNEKMGGDAFKVPVQYADVQGRSHTFSSAQSNRTGVAAAAFLVTRKKDYVSVGIDNEAILASLDPDAAFVKAVTEGMESGFRRAAENLEKELFGDGNSYLGRVGSGEGTATITLQNIEEIVNFAPGQIVQAVTSAGTTLRSGTATIGDIDRDLGTLSTASGNNWTTDISSLTAGASGDWLFQSGDRGSTGIVAQGFDGLKAWIPTSAPSATTFFGVDRTADVSRLGGLRYTASGAPVAEALYAAQARGAREGAKMDVCFLSINKYKELNTTLDSKRVYQDLMAKIPNSTATIGYRSVVVEGFIKPINVFATRHLRDNEGYLLTMDKLYLGSLGGAPKLLSYNGVAPDGVVISNEDALELRIGHYANMYTPNPGWHMYMDLT
ncbi:MAG: hypothetical protein E6Q97_37465 [Desulfurellales bacterium]|nr:MAG: hypothetical protein E6Q97_37465 [Desulfurellales bacterium]